MVCPFTLTMGPADNRRMRLLSCALAGATCLLLGACTPRPSLPAPAIGEATPANVDTVTAVIDEAWISAAYDADELDSLAVWPDETGGLRLLASAKRSERILMFDADSGRQLQAFGGPGSAEGEFRRPNGLAVFGDLLFVVERDNHRVQAFELPSFRALGSFGATELEVPYGIWLDETAPGELTAYVTDSFMADFRTGTLPARERLAERIKRFHITLDDEGGLDARYLDAFGDTSDEGALRMVESIAGDPAHGRLLIADEDQRVGSTLREYALDGRFLGRSLPRFEGDAEGIALWECDIDDGYWIAADQVRPTRFRLFDRRTLAPAGSFSGRRTGFTDGIALHASASQRYPDGVLFALHDDRAVAAFDLGEIARSLQLSPACTQ